ncbi:MAG TPA: hypothetical protein VGB55_14185, partial [Tepidisphaeraceae bacterium]
MTWRLLILYLLLFACPASGQTTLEIEAGFDGRFRAGRWSPVIATVKSNQPRSAILELRVASATAPVLIIRQTIGL